MPQANKTIFWVVAWAVCFTMAFIQTFTAEATGDGFTRGMNRLGIFAVWQMGALFSAIVAALVSRRVSADTFPVIRWMGIAPLIIMAVGLAGVIATFGYTIITGA